MQLLITFLTVLLVLNCLLLILLVLIQLPKKEAGAGLAFGGGTTDALFGPGSGNALTKLTKYSAATFLAMSVILGVMNVRAYHSGTSDVRRALATQKAAATTPAPAAAPAPASGFTKLDPSGTGLMTTVPATATTNAPAVAATNAAPVATEAARGAATTAGTNAAPK